jgi:L-histidine N-alpha-methyltransferase
MLATRITPASAQFAADVREGLDRTERKQIPSKYLYDDLGSALFEAISVTPEYGVTRADERLLRSHAKEIVDLLPEAPIVCELGSGGGKKTRYILDALCESSDVLYYPIEISSAALAACARALNDIRGTRVVGIEREYLEGLHEVARRRDPRSPLLVLFLGSTIGNFDCGSDRTFLRLVRETLRYGDALLLGADLIKPMNRLMAAYDDPTGVTAAFNLNLLARINRELDADFNVREFEHVARFNQATSSVEMHLRSKKRQTVTIASTELTVQLREGETIWTESSHKYSEAELRDLADGSGFRCDEQWIDHEWRFAENLFVVV